MGLFDTLGSILGGIASPVTSIIGTVGSLLNQSSTNDQNVALQRETNEQNYKMFQEGNVFNAAEAQRNRDFQTQMFDATNEWNSAVNQRKRLEQAGLNPYMMMSGGSAGTAQQQVGSEAQAASANPAVAPRVQPIDYSKISDSFSRYLDNEFKEINNKYQAAKLLSEIRRNIKSGDLDEAAGTQLYWDVWKSIDTYDMDKKHKQLENSALQQQIDESIERAGWYNISSKLSQYQLDVLNPMQLKIMKRTYWKLREDVITGRISAKAAANSAAAQMKNALTQEGLANIEKEKWDRIEDLFRSQFQKDLNIKDAQEHFLDRQSSGKHRTRFGLPFNLFDYAEEYYNGNW